MNKHIHMKQLNRILAMLILIIFASCSKKLEEKPFSFLTPSSFYQNEADAQSAINGVLSSLQPQAYYQRTIYIITECPADNLMPLLTQNQERIDMYRLQYTPTNIEITNWWKGSYFMINRANDVIENVPKISMDATKRNHIVGNAQFLRAMAYFDLVRSFGDVPLILKPITSPDDPNLFPTRTPSAQVYQQVIADLKNAETNCLPENLIPSAQKGMVSSGAASAMLARVYLQRASTSFADAQDNQNALAQCNKVISSGIYSLMPLYADVFNWDKKVFPAQTEHIFAVQFGSNGSSVTQNITCRMFSPAQLGGSGSFLANVNFFNNGYGPTDTIRRNWNLANKVGAAGVTPFIYKYRDAQWVAGSNNSRANWIVIRLADVLMMQSEAMNNLTPNDPNKFNGLNTVRSRAGLATSPLSLANTPTQSAFVDTLVKERARELCVEGHRRWDLIRLGRYKQVEASIGFTLQDYQFLLPIPQTELDVNRNLVQNPGYQ
jgi:hypothetical protein